jgi:GAF domain-containing protein
MSHPADHAGSLDGHMALRIDADTLMRALDALPPTTDDVDMGDRLPGLLDAICGVFGITGAGLMLVDEVSGLRYVAATDDGAHVLEQVQEQAGVGPCVESYINDVEVVVPDLETDERWPEIREPLLEAGVRSVLGVPTRLGGGPVGTLNVYTAEPRAWDQSERDAIRAFDTLLEGQIASAVALRHHGRVVEQLQYALENRVAIERAIGMLMARDGIDAVTAFGRLRRTARSSRCTVAVLARDILERRDDALIDR